jgi:hypothetical protein
VGRAQHENVTEPVGLFDCSIAVQTHRMSENRALHLSGSIGLRTRVLIPEELEVPLLVRAI